MMTTLLHGSGDTAILGGDMLGWKSVQKRPLSLSLCSDVLMLQDILELKPSIYEYK